MKSPSGHPWLCNGAGEVSRGHRSLWTGDQPGEQTGWKRTSGSLLRNLRNDQLGGQAGWEGVRTSPIYGCKLLTLYSSHQESKRTLQKWRQTCATNREWIFRGKEQSELWWNQLAWMESHVDFGQVEGKAIFDYPWPRDSGFEKQYFNFLLFECSKTRFSANLFFFLASGSDKVDQYIHIFSRTGTKRGFQQISWNMKLLSSDLLWDMVVFCTLWFFHKKGRSNFPNHSFQLYPNKVV